jgi:hypothetical protein
MCECTDERWLPVPSHVGYDVSSCGRVRSWRSPGKTVGLASTPRFLTGSPGCKGGVYLLYSLQQPRRREYGHKLVAEAFIGPRPAGLNVAHDDGDGHNNHATNLRYDTQLSNIADKLRHGTQERGSAQHSATLTEDQVVEIRELYAAGVMQRTLAARFGVGQQAISNIVRGNLWLHVGGPITTRWSKSASA